MPPVMYWNRNTRCDHPRHNSNIFCYRLYFFSHVLFLLSNTHCIIWIFIRLVKYLQNSELQGCYLSNSCCYFMAYEHSCKGCSSSSCLFNGTWFSVYVISEDEAAGGICICPYASFRDFRSQ